MHSRVLVRNRRLEALGSGFTVSKEKEQLPPEVPAQLRSPGVGGQVWQSPGLQAGWGGGVSSYGRAQSNDPLCSPPQTGASGFRPAGWLQSEGRHSPSGCPGWTEGLWAGSPPCPQAWAHLQLQRCLRQLGSSRGRWKGRPTVPP